MNALIDSESPSVSFHAAKDLLDRAGFHAAERVDVAVLGSIRIDLTPPSTRGGRVDGTHDAASAEEAPGSKTNGPLASTPQPLTIEGESVVDETEGDL
jgi:hypothetical protein